jgi:rhodanese-related sulfurtransferase
MENRSQPDRVLAKRRRTIMKKTTALLIAGLALTASLAYSAEQSPAAAAGTVPGKSAQAPQFKAHVLTRAELDDLLAKPDKLLIIDVRRPDEISSIGGLPVYLNVQVDDVEKSLAWIPKDRTIVTLSNHAGRAGKVADLLGSKGFKVAGAAGAQTYAQQGGVLTKVSAPPHNTAVAAAPAAASK